MRQHDSLVRNSDGPWEYGGDADDETCTTRAPCVSHWYKRLTSYVCRTWGLRKILLGNSQFLIQTVLLNFIQKTTIIYSFSSRSHNWRPWDARTILPQLQAHKLCSHQWSKRKAVGVVLFIWIRIVLRLEEVYRPDTSEPLLAFPQVSTAFCKLVEKENQPYYVFDGLIHVMKEFCRKKHQK